MIRKIRKTLKKRLFTRTLYSTRINGLEYRVVESKSFLPSVRDTRALVFLSEKDKRTYIQSMIYLDEKYHLQPSMMTPQEIIGIWGKTQGLGNVLVLGCAGCAIPRYLSLEFPGCKVKGIEHSAEIIDIAERFFLTDESRKHLDIEKADAFEYVKMHCDGDEKFDAVFVDLFDSERLPREIYSENFVDSLCGICGENAIAVFNMLNEEQGKIRDFAKNINNFYCRLLITEGQRNTLLLIKKSGDNTLDGLTKIIKDNWEVVEI